MQCFFFPFNILKLKIRYYLTLGQIQSSDHLTLKDKTNNCNYYVCTYNKI